MCSLPHQLLSYVDVAKMVMAKLWKYEKWSVSITVCFQVRDMREELGCSRAEDMLSIITHVGHQKRARWKTRKQSTTRILECEGWVTRKLLDLESKTKCGAHVGGQKLIFTETRMRVLEKYNSGAFGSNCTESFAWCCTGPSASEIQDGRCGLKALRPSLSVIVQLNLLTYF